MEITISELVQNYGLDSVLIAVAVCILTGLVKMPIKSLTAKTKNSSKYTKYITFLPLLFGFGITVLYEYIMMKSISFTKDFITLWITSSSLSLAIYAFIEKFIPSKKKILSTEEIRQNEEMLNSIKSVLITDKISEDAEKSAGAVFGDNEEKQDFAVAEMPENNLQVVKSVQDKIILRGRKNV